MLSTVTGQAPSLSLQTSQEISGESLGLPAEASGPSRLPNLDQPRAKRDWTSRGVRRGSEASAREDTALEPKSRWGCWRHITTLHSRESRNPRTPEGTSLIPPTHTHTLWPPPLPRLVCGGSGQYKHTRAALFPMPNFSLKNFSVPSQYDRESPGFRAGTHGAHSPPRAALGVRGCGSAPGCPHRTAVAPGARAAHGPRASAERLVRLAGAHRCRVPSAAWPGGGRLGSEPAARSLALNW